MFNIKNLFSSVKRVWPWVKNHKVWSAVIAVVFIIIVFSLTSGGDASLASKTSEVKTGTVAQEVSVTGRVKSAEAVNLSFERSGRATWIPATVGAKVRQGQTLVQLDAGETVAQRQQAQAGVMSAQARYNQLVGGADITATQINVTIADRSLRETVSSSISSAVSAIVTLSDIQYKYFNNPNSARSEDVLVADAKERALYAFYGQNNLGRVNSWYLVQLKPVTQVALETDVTNSNTVSISQDTYKALTLIARALDIATSALSQNTSIVSPADKSSVTSATSSVHAQITALVNAQGVLESAKAQLNLKVVGESSTDLLIAKSELEQAKASLALIDAQLAKYTLRAPFAGTITDVDVTRGEVVSPNAPVVSLIGNGNFEIEANISEADIASVKVGNTANVTFDAYGQGSLFNAQVVHIDPAGTIQGGVAVYRVTLQFSKQDERILAGLTANVDLQTAQKDDVVFVPSRDIITRNGKKFVKVLLPIDSSDSRFANLAAVSESKTQRIVEIEISTGLRGSDGRTEILSGVQVGDLIVGQ